MRFPAGVADLGTGAFGGLRNLLVNAAGTVNQRGVTGTLAAGSFGPDRWRAGQGGCTVTVADGRWTLEGTLEQPIEAPGLAGRPVCVSVEDPGGDLSVQLGSATGTIPAGSGRKFVRLVPGAGDTGDLVLRLTAVSPTSFGLPQVEESLVATPFERRPAGLELALCQRYFYRFSPGTAGGMFLCMKQTTQQWRGLLPTPVPLRAMPDITYTTGARKARIYNYAGAFVEIDAMTVIGLLPTGVQVAYDTAADMGPSLAIVFPFVGNVIDCNSDCIL